MGSVFAMTTTIPVIKGTGKIPGSPIPQNRRQAMKNPFWTGYQAAEGVEMELHRVNGTWKYVPLSSVPVDKIILDTKWVYDDKIEIDAKGEPYITRLKARLTAMGNFQRKGIDYQDVFASVMRGQSLRLLLLIRLLHASHRMEKWDAKAAFINAVLKPESNSQRVMKSRGRRGWYVGLSKRSMGCTNQLQPGKTTSMFISRKRGLDHILRISPCTIV